MASLKNTKSMPAPRTMSLYCCMQDTSFSERNSKEGTYGWMGGQGGGVCKYIHSAKSFLCMS